MKPSDKAAEIFSKGQFNTSNVLWAFVERSPQIFLQLAEKHKIAEVVTVSLGEVKLSGPQHREMLAYLRQSNIVGAIKYVRAVTGSGLRESKFYVDKYRTDR